MLPFFKVIIIVTNNRNVLNHKVLYKDREVTA